MLCPICKKESKKLGKVEGYIPGSFYDIFNCNNCNCNHMDIKKIDKNIYDTIYAKAEKIAGYDKYTMFYNKIKKQKNPLHRLSKTDDTYSSVYEFLKEKKGLKCLEIGTGLGYLTYAINESGNRCIGIDISKESISKAKKMFGDNYIHGDITKISDNLGIFDVIIATEIIEHLDDFEAFFDFCFVHLKKQGTLIITTPNKDYQEKALRFGDLPPVHTILFSKKTFKYIADKYNVKINLSPAGDKSNINNLVVNIYFRLLPSQTSKPHLKDTNIKQRKSIGQLLFTFSNTKPIRFLCNIISRRIFGKGSGMVLHCILRKK